MASNKLTFDFGQPPNFDGLAEQKLIAHSVNVESLADGSGVRTRSGMRHAYQFRQYTDQMSDSTQIISGLRTPNAENINSNELGIDIIYAVDDNGKYIIKDMKQTTIIQHEGQWVTFSHVQGFVDDTKRLMVFTDDYTNYCLVLNRLSGNKKVVVNYTVGLITSVGQEVYTYNSIFAYSDYPVYNNINNDEIIKGILTINPMMEGLSRSIDTYSIVGSATLNPTDTYIKIPIPNIQYEEAAEGTSFLIRFIPIVLNFTEYTDGVPSTTDTVRTTDIKLYVVSDGGIINEPYILENQSGQGNTVTFENIYTDRF